MSIGKREQQRLERRAKIIAVAREHFFTHGYADTGMSAIAAKLGGSKGTLWNYFPSKEALFAAVVDDTAAGIRSEMDWPTGDDPIQCLTKLCRSVIDRVLSPMVIAMFRLIGPTADRLPEVGRTFYERGPGGTMKMVGDYLRENFSDILWVTDYPRAGAELVMFAGSRFHFERIWGFTTPPTGKERDVQARRAALLFLRAYAKDPDKYAPRELIEELDGESVA